MRYLAIISTALMIASCTTNNVCLEKGFGDVTWIRDNTSISWDNVKFQDNGNFIADVPSMGVYNITWGTFQFDEGCGGFNLHYTNPTDTTFHYLVEKINSSQLWIKQDGSTQVWQFHK